MEPKYVVYHCDNCDKLFYREVAEVLTDDVDDCHVRVALLADAEGNPEEFPMCECVGGDAGSALYISEEEENEISEDAE